MAQIFLSLGSNQEREVRISMALDALCAHFGELQLSSVYESEAVGFDGDNFLNLVVGCQTVLPLGSLRQLLKKIEDENGRIRGGAKFSNRTLDIDILTYGDLAGDFDGLQLPREEITKNAFVLLPLAEIAGECRHPLSNEPYEALWDAYDKSKQQLWAVDFSWRGTPISTSS